MRRKAECTYDDCLKTFNLDDPKEKRRAEEHRRRYHLDLPVEFKDDKTGAVLAIYRDKTCDMKFRCICRAEISLHSSVKRHYDSCTKAINAVSSFIGNRDTKTLGVIRIDELTPYVDSGTPLPDTFQSPSTKTIKNIAESSQQNINPIPTVSFQQPIYVLPIPVPVHFGNNQQQQCSVVHFQQPYVVIPPQQLCPHQQLILPTEEREYYIQNSDSSDKQEQIDSVIKNK
ncbi:hypothetical protein BGZ49_000071 [Haplosporangium sp. Z 27]|nr:hypothetical protein BGZ49_000071 [Haplosporangium sp. Z 27]